MSHSVNDWCIGTKCSFRLYKTSSSSNEYFEMVPAYDGSYLASNLDILDPRDGKRVPFAQRYKKFTTKVQGIRIMAFGFLYDFTGNSNNTIVQPVKETIQEDWFREAIRDREVDLFVVTGHATARSEEFLALYQAIRDEQWDTPIMFFGGHLHVRDFKKYDTRAYALASGRYMETIGFQSISGLDTGVKSSSPEKRASPTFARRYVDNNLHSFYHHTASNSTTFPTEHGKSLSAKITTARKSLDLDSRFGCAPQDLWTNRAPYPSNSSIFTWLATQVMPDMVVEPERAPKPRIVISNTGAMRFDIFKGPFTKDTTYIVSPFTSGFRFIQDVPYDIADRLLTVLNNAGPIFDQALPSLKASMFEAPEQMGRSSDSIASSSLDYQATRQQTVFDDKQELTPGYTTVDDAGDDGDDTLHSEISFYRVPNCFEARVNTTTSTDSGEDKPVDKVDLVFGDFIQPWVLLALKFLGGEYEDGSTQAYLEGTDFTTLIAKWIQENWNGDC